MVDGLKGLLAPAAWAATLGALVALAGVTFNTVLSLLVGARLASHSTLYGHFSAGAGLLPVALVHAADFVMAAIYTISGLGLFIVASAAGSLVLASLIVLALDAASRVLSGRRLGDVGSRVLAEKVIAEGRRRFRIWRPVRTPAIVARPPRRWLLRSWLLILVTASAVAAFFVFWAPFVEATRFRDDLKTAATSSLERPSTAGRTGREKMFPILSKLGSARQDTGTLSGFAWLDTKFRAPAGWVSSQVEEWGTAWNLDKLIHRPKLVTVSFRSEKGALRPMLTVAEYGGTLVLYDFLLDAKGGDNVIYPIRTVSQSDIRSTTAIDPRSYLTEGDDDPAGAIAPLPILAILTAVCGIDPRTAFETNDQDSDTVRVTKERIRLECMEGSRDFPSCIRKQFVREDVLACRARDLEQPEELVQRENPAPLQSIYISWPPNPAGSDFTQRLTELGERLADLIEAQPVPPPPPPVFLFQEASVPGQAPGRPGRWQGCVQMASWRNSGTGLEFAKGSALLEGPLRHGLVLDGVTTDRGAAWTAFEQVVDTWLAEAAAERGERPNDQKVLFLIGQASVDGGNSFNLALTERRAHAVREILVRRREALIDAGLITDPGKPTERIWIIPFGEGESIQAPDELIDSNSLRRVDAHLCHGAVPLIGARFDIQ